MAREEKRGSAGTRGVEAEGHPAGTPRDVTDLTWGVCSRAHVHVCVCVCVCVCV